MNYEVVKLNIGGKQFVTSNKTIIKSPFFKSYLSGRWKTQKTGVDEIFIDRDPFYFGSILNYLRGQRLNLSKFTVHNFIEFIIDANYYGIEIDLSRFSKYIFCRKCSIIILQSLYRYRVEESSIFKDAIYCPYMGNSSSINTLGFKKRHCGMSLNSVFIKEILKEELSNISK